MMILFDSIYASYSPIIRRYLSILIRLGDFYSNVPNQNNKRGGQKLSSESENHKSNTRREKFGDLNWHIDFQLKTNMDKNAAPSRRIVRAKRRLTPKDEGIFWKMWIEFLEKKIFF